MKLLDDRVINDPHPGQYSCDLCDQWRKPKDLVEWDEELICREHLDDEAFR
jgi:hypothetical protein